jgi:SET domain-containing protein
LDVKAPEDEGYYSSGVWLKASYINHSCLSNVHRSFIGDLQLVRAACDIPPNTELTFWYRNAGFGSYEETQKEVNNWGFECGCPICLDTKNTPKKMLKRRDALRGDLKTALDASILDVAKTERLLVAIELTYKFPPSEVPRLALWEAYHSLMHAYVMENQPVKLLASALKGLECLGFVIKGANPFQSPGTPFGVVQWGVMIDTVLEVWMHLWTTYSILAPQLCQKAEECMRVAYKICLGEDVTFEEFFASKVRQVVNTLLK